MRMGMPASPAASSTASVAARPPMLPGLMRNFAAPRRAASMAMTGSKCTSATTGRGDASHTAAKASRQARRGMAMRTISQPAWANASIWAKLAATSSAGALSMDCTATGAPPPTGTPPTMTRRVRWLGRSSATGWLAAAASAEVQAVAAASAGAQLAPAASAGAQLAPAASASQRASEASTAQLVPAALAEAQPIAAVSAEARSVATTSAKELLVSAGSVMASSAFAETSLRSDSELAAYCTASACTPPRRTPTP